MTATKWFDKTTATRKTPGDNPVDRTTGKFTYPSQTLTTIRIHVTKPKLDEALPGGIHFQAGDVLIHADKSLGLQANEILEFWDADWRIVAELRRYDTLDAVVNHDRVRYLARRLGEADNNP